MSAKRKETMKEFSSDSDSDKQDKIQDFNEDLENSETEMEKMSKRFLKFELPHKLNPKFNRCEQRCVKELVTFPSYIFGEQHFVHAEPKHYHPVDLCHRLPKAKITWYQRLKGARWAYRNHMKSKHVRKLAKKDIYPVSLFNFAKRLEYDPDKYFEGLYDFYYTGGNICTLSDENKYVVHVGGENLQELRISEFANNKDPVSELTTIFHKNLSNDEPIYEAQTLKSFRVDCPNIFAVRRRKHISIHSFSGENKIFKTFKEFVSKETPFISFAQNRIDSNTFAVSNMSQEIRIYDLETSKGDDPMLKFCTVEEDKIGWNAIKSYDRNVYVYAGMEYFTMMDTRESPKEWAKNACHIKQSKLTCINLSSITLSNFDNLLYIGSTHDFYCCDIRRLPQFIGGKETVCCWTHLMDFRPIMLETYKYQNSEITALASPISDDIRICELIQESVKKDESNEHSSKKRKISSNENFIYNSSCLPYQPPTLDEIYSAARFNGKCLSPYADLYNRIRCCNTGMCFYGSKDDNDLKLLTSTSNGDVYAHNMSERLHQNPIDRTNDKTTDNMCRYEEKILQIVPNCLNYTEIFPMSSFGKVMRWKKLDVRDKDDFDDNNSPIDIAKTNRGWRKPVQSLYAYKDALASSILSIWDIESDEKNDQFDLDLSTKDNGEVDSSNIVSDWLEKAPLNSSINENEITAISNTISISPQQPETEIFDTSFTDPTFADFEPELLQQPQSTQTVEQNANLSLVNEVSSQEPGKKLKLGAKRKSYVKGF